VRLPAIAISAWIPEGTVVNDVHHSTPVIRTMRERWDLGVPLSARDADAPDLAPVLSRAEPRAPEDWPDVAPQPVPDFDEDLVPRDTPLGPLPSAMFRAYLALVKQLGVTVPEIPEDAELKGGEALDIVHETAGDLFPGLRQP
jgi:phospholipase C